MIYNEDNIYRSEEDISCKLEETFDRDLPPEKNYNDFGN